MLTALSNPRSLLILGCAVVVILCNIGPVWSWLASLASGIKLPSLAKSGAATGTDRTRGEVLDCLNADLDFFRAHTDAPAEKLKAVEDLAAYLMHTKTAPVAPSAPQAPVVSA